MEKRHSADELNKMNKEELVALFLALQEQNALFQEQIATMQNQKYGRKTERLECMGQESLFNEAEAEAEEDTDEKPETEKITCKRKKRTPGKLDEMLKGLPSRIENHELSHEELTEIFGKDGWKRLPDDVYRKLEYHPSTKEVVEHHVAVYAAKREDKIVRAPHPAELLVHSIATPSLVAAVINAKYTNAMPLYRIGQEFERYDVKIPVPTMANWVIRCAERYLYPLTDRLRTELHKLPVVQADETVCKVSKDGRPANAESRMFVYRSGELNSTKNIVLFDYQKTRNADHLEAFLEDFSGILVSDAYGGYHALENRNTNIHVAHCWAHARRNYADALKLLQKQMSKKNLKKTIAYQALDRIASFYALEESWKDLSPEERRSHRQEHTKPLVEAYFAWVKTIDQDSIISENTRKGLNYSINQEKYLKVFLEHGDVPIDNSASERAIRPFCVGRGNWRLIDSIHGAQASAAVYSIVETAKANRLKPYEYLKYILTEMPKHMEDTDFSFMDDLLPWSDSIPAICKKTDLMQTSTAK